MVLMCFLDTRKCYAAIFSPSLSTGETDPEYRRFYRVGHKARPLCVVAHTYKKPRLIPVIFRIAREKKTYSE